MVRTAPPVSVRVRVRVSVSVSFSFTEIDYHGPAAPCCPSEAVQALRPVFSKCPNNFYFLI